MFFFCKARTVDATYYGIYNKIALYYILIEGAYTVFGKWKSLLSKQGAVKLV